MDENKENRTPEGGQQQEELDWVQQYSLYQEREERELQQALAQSLQEHVRSKDIHMTASRHFWFCLVLTLFGTIPPHILPAYFVVAAHSSFIFQQLSYIDVSLTVAPIYNTLNLD